MEKNAALHVERDLAYAQAMAEELKEYLLGSGLYEQLSAHGYTLPMGTLGGLFLRLHRLQALRDQLTDEQAAELEKIAEHVEAEVDHWRVQAEEKMQREIKARLHNWHEYLHELERQPRHYGGEFPTQVEGRTVVDLLMEAAGDAAPPEAVAELREADRHIRDYTEPADFVWDDDMQPAFPRERYWWLYVWPRERQ